jgi:prephenate dehydratase
VQYTNLKLGSLGGPNTFGGEAAHRMLELYPMFSEIVYFPTSEEAQRFESADASCAPQQMGRTGPHTGTQQRIAAQGSTLYVIAEVTHAYHCSLLVKPGTPQGNIRRVQGHTGSVTQCRDWLRENVPQAEIVIVDTNSMGAAAEAAESDGSIASIGTPGMARQFGLQELHTDIDGHSVGAYWAVSLHPVFSDRPTRLVIAGRFAGNGRISGVIQNLANAGYGLDTVYAQPTGKQLYEYDYALRFSGAGSLSAVQRAVSGFSEARVAGAFEWRD